MNKTDRLLAIVLELQRKEVLRAEDLAHTFETSVRTIYRDIQALSEAGVPVIGAPGLGYSLMEGYFLPPISFTVEEAVTLIIGTDFIEQRFDVDYGIGAQTSRGKIEAILPESVRRETSRVRKTIRLLSSGEDVTWVKEKEYIESARGAILGERKISFHYLKRIPEADGNRHSFRVVAPYGLVLVKGSWILIAHCDLREEIRHFRLSRMTGLTILEDRFKVPTEFNLNDYKPPDDRNVHVIIQINPDIADKVKESNNFYMEAIEENENRLHATFRVRQPDELLHWVLGWGSDVVVLEPESFRNRIREEAEKMLKRY
ncbi:helix-turn-helix transcriptional regulator [Gottfriedia acidiceleris]|uniref:helix-turn-helix transcriptional regulator n=1 Tax=Gottfriedia acidiceleris TaxID=371036 RepID=UPI003000F8FE